MDALILLGLLILASSVLGVVAFVLVLLVRAETRFHGTRILELSRKLNRLIQQSEPAAPETPAAAPEEEPAPAAIRALQQWGRFEEMVGKRGIAWAGALVLFLAAGFFVKYAIDMGWLGPAARVILGIIGGLVLAGAGEVSVRRKMPALG